MLNVLIDCRGNEKVSTSRKFLSQSCSSRFRYPTWSMKKIWMRFEEAYQYRQEFPGALYHIITHDHDTIHFKFILCKLQGLVNAPRCWRPESDAGSCILKLTSHIWMWRKEKSAFKSWRLCSTYREDSTNKKAVVIWNLKEIIHMPLYSAERNFWWKVEWKRTRRQSEATMRD